MAMYSTHIGDNFLQQVLRLVYAENISAEQVADTHIFVPTNRLAKALQTDILRKFDGTPTLMPHIISISHDDSITDTTEFYGGAYIAPPIDNTQRQLWLADAVWGYYNTAAALENISFAMAIEYANQLSQLFDNLQLYEVSFDDFLNCAGDMGGAVSDHWAVTTTFLQHFYPLWQAYLKQQGVCDVGAYRMQCYRHLIDHLHTRTNRIFCVGFTATYPIIGRLIDEVAGLPNSTVILPAYADSAYTDDIRNDPSHPYYVMAAHVGDSRPQMLPAARPQRHTICSQVFLPAVCTRDWNTISPADKAEQDVFSGMRFMTCSTPVEEAMAIALALREVLETEGKTGALITADKHLSRMVISILNRWHIHIDDSSGMPLHLTPVAVFMRLVLQAQAENFSPTALVKLLKHPLCHMGYDRGVLLRKVRQLEKIALRGYVMGAGLQGIIDTLYHRLDTDKYFLRAVSDKDKKTQKVADLVAFLQEIADHFTPLSPPHTDLKHILTAHIQVAENLAGVDVLWAKQDGSSMAETCASILDNTDVLTLKQTFSISEYTQLFVSLLRGRTVRKIHGLHPRLYIWGVLEGRLQTVDTVIFGGCNEGTLPSSIHVDIWVSNAMARAVGLPTMDRFVGVSAHDVLSACNGDTVIFSRAAKQGGTPTIASRWWQRFEAVGKAYGVSLPPPDTDYAALALHIDAVDDSTRQAVKISVPKPTPPLAMRPQQLSMTNIQTWYEDPYQIYAKHILKLYKVDDLASEVNPAFKGTLIHTILERFTQQLSDTYFADPNSVTYQQAVQCFDKIAHDHFAPYQGLAAVRLQIIPEFNDFAPHFVKEFWQRLQQTRCMYFEKDGTHTLHTPQNNSFKIRGIADRIDITHEGTAIVVDYKTGADIAAKHIDEGTVPQLILQAYMVTQGAYTDIGTCAVDIAEYWMTKRKFKIVSHETMAVLDTNLHMLYGQIDTYMDVHTPYYTEYRSGKSQTYNDYEHLFREQEWNTTEADT